MVAVEVVGAVVVLAALLALSRHIVGRFRPAGRPGRDSVGGIGDRGHVMIMPFGEVLHTGSGHPTNPNVATDEHGPDGPARGHPPSRHDRGPPAP